MLQPVRTKWRKAHKGRLDGTASRVNFINYELMLKALTPERVTGKQIEAARATDKTYEETRTYGQEYFQISQFQKPIEVVWVKEKDLQNIMAE